MDEFEAPIVHLSYKEKVPLAAVKEIISHCTTERLSNLVYDDDKCDEIAKALSSEIRTRLKSLGYDRYKYIVHVLIGERREQGVRCV